MSLETYTDQQLLEEVAKRLQLKLPSSARARPPKKHATKAEWADAKAAEMRAQYEQVSAEQVTGEAAERRKMGSLQTLLDEENKFKRMAAAFRRKGL
ncbi:hypothetical protein AB8810_10910 [Xanthomonas sp. NCPPB 3005]|uniref:hypothetical protein n=1 Tax=Xanthomonas sp. NCPPB 3005 TaxID=3240913 RepID=UPI0035148866